MTENDTESLGNVLAIIMIALAVLIIFFSAKSGRDL